MVPVPVARGLRLPVIATVIAPDLSGRQRALVFG
jgi:hypothetical protein